MNFIRNLKIRDQLLTLLFLLLVPLLYFVIVQFRQEIIEIEAYETLMNDLTESEKISEYIHQLQKEQARIIAASEGDSVFLMEAITQRDRTEASEKDLKDFLGESGRSFSDISLLDEVQQHRNRLDEGKLDQEEFSNYSSDLIFSFLGRIDENATAIRDVEIGRHLQSFKNLAEAKVHLGRVRSSLMKILQKDTLSFAAYADFESQKSSYLLALNNFKRYATQDDLKEIQELIVSDNYKKVTSIFREIAQNPMVALGKYDPVRIFSLLSQNVESLRGIERKMISRIKAQVEQEYQQSRRGLISMGLLIVLILGLAGLLSVYIINFISSSLSSLKTAADRIMLGDTDINIGINSTNEIGVVANSFRGVVHKNKNLTKVAQAIGDSNYNVEVEIQGPEDRLSFAILEMKENMRRFALENQKRHWILTGISELNNLITSENNINEVTEKVVSFLCSYTDSQAGVFYLHNDAGNLVPSATYGVASDTEQLTSFKIGAGQVGQAVSENRIKILEEIPEKYLTIKSGLAEIVPANIIIIPLQFTDTIIGAVELCARVPYNEQQQEFLKAAGDRAAIILQSLKAHFKTQHLLYETQNQAEELETQQEELRELNAELKASEEELKVSQEELQEKNAELEEKAQLLEEQYEALRTKNNALEDAREAIELKIQQVEAVSKYKSEFLANMSHELRTPLNSILILSRLLADNPENTLNAKQAEHARIIHKSGSDLLRLINEILDLSKIESGMIRLDMEDVKLESLDLEPTFQELARNKNIDFKIYFDQDGPDSIYTDRFRLEQILKNFLSNAIKFTDSGGKVELSVKRIENKHHLQSGRLRESDEIVAFSVTDTGIGIPKEKQHAIFEAFQQADSSTTRKYGGTGLGLAISKELANLLGGEISLVSKEGSGSTFTLYLPAKPREKAEPIKAPAREKKLSLKAIAGEKGNDTIVQQRPGSASTVLDRLADNKDKKEIAVLIIEDDKGFNDILADFAKAKNFKVHQALTGNEGLELARKIKPDAIMLDIHLPDISGWNVLQEIREDKDLRHVNVHVMSAYDKEVVSKQQKSEEYLPKPVTLEMLNTAFTTISTLSDSSIETILIVEDNEVENNAIAELLMAHSLQSVSAFSAEEAERLLTKNKIDCIILDLNLPGMKGYEWMEKIRSTKGLSEIPIIIYSGKDLSEEEEIKLKKFANTIIIKNEYSYLRLLDEVQLFLHKVNQKLPLGNDFKMKLHIPEEILRNKKVLLVDDDVRNVYSLSNLLELEGMKITEAYNGKEALSKLQEEDSVDIVLMDVMMPEMDGMEAMRRIRKIDRFKDLPIIALTAKAMKEDKEKCIEAGASDYIPKPVDTDKLLTLMRIWLYEA